jgi:hypothetical protein
VIAAAERARLDAILAARDRDFPRRDPANTAALEAALDAYVERLRAARDAAWAPDPGRLAEARAMAPRPVLVCGYMKSGTTFLVGLLDQHPQLTVLPGDSHMLTLVERQRGGPPDAGGAAGDRYWTARLVNPTGQRPFWFLGDDDRAYVELARYLEHWLAELPPAPESPFLAGVLALHCANPRRVPRPAAWVEKTPWNELRARAALAVYPQARFVHVVRHPLENLASMKQLVRHRGWGWRGAISATTTAWRLRRSLRAGLDNQRRLGAERYLFVVHERLLADPPAETRRLADFLGIEWDENLLRPTVNGAPQVSNSMYGDRRVAGEIVRDAPSRWRTELSPLERRLASAILGPTLRRLGHVS